MVEIAVATLGFPRIGAKRALKTALEHYWTGTSDAAALLTTAAALRANAWQQQQACGATIIPSNDFSLYDHVLDISAMVGALPGAPDLDAYFTAARGSSRNETACAHAHAPTTGQDHQPAAEMTKWFDTNYHYLVPRFHPAQSFRLSSTKPLDEYREARQLGLHTRPVLLGPVSYLLLGKSEQRDFDPLTLLPGLVAVYAEMLSALADAGADWVQIDEPCLTLDLTEPGRAAYRSAYASLHAAVPHLKLMLTTYFGALDDNLTTALALPVQGLHIDLVRAPEQLEPVLAAAPADWVLSLGVIDGRNIWRADLAAILDWLERVAQRRSHLVLAPSCSLLHVPIDLTHETKLNPEIRDWLAFATQKIGELSVLAQALTQGRARVEPALRAASAAQRARRHSPRIHQPAVKERAGQTDPALSRRASPYQLRHAVQAAKLRLPPFPTTTIGSFPQTTEIRQARADFAKGRIDQAQYQSQLQDEITRAVQWQDSIGLDVLVHGEFERNDMVQYFGEQLDGFAFTTHGWVQSYGSRCVRPPIIYGDVARPHAMTIDWWRYAQSLTHRPMKGMLTGPVTILNWSFVRDDQPRAQTCRQIAFAIRDEVTDLEAAGAAIIQIDEAALREGLPLRRRDWSSYLAWAVEAFRISASGVADATQIHTHMCYSEFNDIIEAIGAMDADVISIETARSRMELLDAFATYHYPAAMGPGVYDIHSPAIPTVDAMTSLLKAATHRLPAEQIWVNPDCGLKTRHWPEVRAALDHMVQAAALLRATGHTP
ncbi:5-methyltetrahydropteroyltriglutamate--homocysteine methyltransferase [Acidiphilium sp. MT5]